MLYNPFGRCFPLFGRLDRQTYKQGYAFIPQSTVTDINKIALHRMSKHIWPLMDTHDGMLISVPRSQINEAVKWLVDAYNVEVEIHGIKHIIPIEVTVGENWYEMEEIEV